MLVDRDRRPQGAPYPDEAYGPQAGPRRTSALHRFLGGSPAGVFARLLVLSVLVGAGLSTLGLTPGRLFWQAYEAARALIELAGASLHDVSGWVLAGAVVVVPLWLITRLLAVSR